MEKIDLIIDALESYFCLDDSTQFTMDKAYAALAAARELKALEPVGEIRTIVWGGMAWSVGFISHKKLNLRTKLYALDEVTK